MIDAGLTEEEGGGGLAGPRAMTRVLRMFALLSEFDEGLSLAGLATELGVPKSTLRNSLRPLLADGYLLAPEGRYRLGPRAYQLGAKLMAGWSPMRNLRPFMRHLVEITGESVAIAQLDREGRRFNFIDSMQSPHGVRFVVQAGRSGPLHVGASGRVLLAFEPEIYREAYLATGPFEAATPNTITDPEVLRGQLNDIRRTGLLVALGESIVDGAAIAAPVFGPQGDVIAAFMVGGPLARLRPEIERLSQALLETAKSASGQYFPLDS